MNEYIGLTPLAKYLKRRKFERRKTRVMAVSRKMGRVWSEFMNEVDAIAALLAIFLGIIMAVHYIIITINTVGVIAIK